MYEPGSVEGRGGAGGDLESGVQGGGGGARSERERWEDKPRHRCFKLKGSRFILVQNFGKFWFSGSFLFRLRGVQI